MPKEKIVPRPPAYVMEVLITNLFDGGEEQKKIAITLTSFVLEYEGKCSAAEAELMQKAHELLKSSNYTF
jgi:hypothetical protein